MEHHSLKDRVVSSLTAEDIERLRQSEEENRAILNNVIDGIITIDETGKILRFNPAAEKMSLPSPPGRRTERLQKRLRIPRIQQLERVVHTRNILSA